MWPIDHCLPPLALDHTFFMANLPCYSFRESFPWTNLSQVFLLFVGTSFTHTSQFVIQFLYCCQFATSQKAEIISALYTTGFPAPIKCLIHKRCSVSICWQKEWRADGSSSHLTWFRVLGRFSVLQKDPFPSTSVTSTVQPYSTLGTKVP